MIQIQRWSLAVVMAVVGSTLAACGSGNDENSSAPSADCRPAHTFPTVSSGALTVVVPNVPPYAVPGPAGLDDPGGIDGEIVKLIAAKECLKIKGIAGTFASAIASISSGKADMVIGDWTRTKDRAKVVNLSDPLYLEKIGFLSKSGVSEISDLKGQSVGSPRGFLWNAEFKKYLGSSFKEYPDNVSLMSDLKSGRLEVGVFGSGSAAYLVEHGGIPGLKLGIPEPDDQIPSSQSVSQSGFPSTQGNDKLTEALNADIQELHDTGKIGEILEKYGLPASLTETGAPSLS